MTGKSAVLKALQQYQRLAAKHLFRSRDVKAIEFLETEVKLEVQFLFPNLDEAERFLLSELGSTRRGYMIGVRAADLISKFPLEDKRKIEADYHPIEVKFTELRAKVEAEIMPKLTAVQKAILRERFLKIRFKT